MTPSDGGAVPARAPDPSSRAADQRRDRRRHLLWSGVLQTARGPSQCTVMDISSGGARLCLAPAHEVGQAVTLLVHGLGLFRGTVIWRDVGELGIAFADEPGRASR